MKYVLKTATAIYRVKKKTIGHHTYRHGQHQQVLEPLYSMKKKTNVIFLPFVSIFSVFDSRVLEFEDEKKNDNICVLPLNMLSIPYSRIVVLKYAHYH